MEEAHGVARRVGVGAFAEEAAAIAARAAAIAGGTIRHASLVVGDRGEAHVEPPFVGVEAAAVLAGFVGVDFGALWHNLSFNLLGSDSGVFDVIIGPNGDVAMVSINTAAAAIGGRVVADVAACDGDVAEMVVDAAAVQVGGVVEDFGSDEIDGALVEIDTAATPLILACARGRVLID